MAKRRREIAPIRAVRYLFHRATLLVRPTPQREQLHYLLASANPKASLQERVVWLEQLMIWIRTASVHQHSFDPETGQLHNARLRFFLHLLRRNPEWRDNVSKTLRTSLEETSALVLFSQVGLGQHRGFVAEATDRVFKNTLPRPAQDQELSDLFLRIFKDVPSW